MLTACRFLASHVFRVFLLLLGLANFVGLPAAYAQTFSNVVRQVYRTTGSGSSTAFNGFAPSTAGNTYFPVGSGNIYDTRISNFGLPANTPFMISWAGRFNTTYPGIYTFTVTADDGFRFSLTGLGGTQAGAFSNWADSPPTTRTYQVALSANTAYDFILSYYEL